MTYQFSEAINRNIEQTYTFPHVKGAYHYGGTPEMYDPHAFFGELVEKEPFEAFMKLNRFGFKRTLNTLNRYQIPYTKEQEYRARVFYEITEQMASERKDAVRRYVEGDLSRAKLVKLTDDYLITTKDTLRVAEFIKYELINKPKNNIIYESKANELILESKEQLLALKTSLQNQISCVIGSAGTGKSYVTAEIINQLQLNDKKVAVLAPTHKAKEALQEKMDDIKTEVKTIHSFVYHPFDCDAIVIDEAGMLSTPLVNQLAKVYDNQQMIFVGDKNQLPPIQYGRPFERIQEIHKVSELRKNRRSEARDIISLGNQILGIPQNENMEAKNITITVDPKKAYQQGAEVILTYKNKDVRAINEIQRLKQGADSLYKGFKVGEKIIAKTNYKNKFYNGQLFRVAGINLIEDIHTGKIVRINSSKEFEYNFDYAYALTIHKSQGSEWDAVGYLPSDLDTVNLAYVAVTRAKKKLIIINGLAEEYRKDKKWRQLYEDYRI